MVVKILSPSAGFKGISYNTRKIDRNKGELMKTANFGPLQGLGHLKPRDYVNYLSALSALNRNVKMPQFHAVLSGKGRSYDKVQLTGIAESWLKEMGYGDQPYLIVYHKDTENNHVHLVTGRVGRNGKKISSAYEHVRAQRNMNKVLGYDHALQYKFSTRAQFFMLLESGGFPGIDPDERKIREVTDKYSVDKQHASQIAALLNTHRGITDLRAFMIDRYHIELIFHAAEGKQPYGYSIIDHEAKMVFKGSEVLALKMLLRDHADLESKTNARTERPITASEAQPEQDIYISPVSIADDVDDQQIHGMRRKRQRKSRTNTR